MNGITSRKIKYKGYHDTTVAKMLLNVFPAQFFLYVLNSLLSTVNGIVISKTQPVQALSALALCSPLSTLRAVLSITISTGMIILCGHKVGSGNGNGIRKVISTSVFMAVATGLISTALTLIFRVPIARLLGANDEILGYTVDYLTGIALGILPTILISLFVNIIQMNGKAYDVIVLGFLRLGLMLMAVFSTAYLFKGNLLWISVSSSASSVMTAIILYICVRKRTPNYGGFAGKIHMPFAKEIALLGIPAAAVSVMTGIRDIWLNNITVSCGGAKAAAAMGILSTVWFLIDGVIYGMGFSTGMLSSVSYGERDSDTLRSIFRESVKKGTLLTAITALLYFILIRNISSLLTTDPVVTEYAVKLVRIYVIGRIAVLWSMIFINIYQSCKKTVAVFICNLLAFLLFPVVFSIALKNKIGVDSVWWAYTVGPAAMLIVLPLITFVLNKKFPRSLYDILLFNDKKEKYVINRLVSSKEEAINISAEIIPVLCEKGLSRRESFVYALCLEETAVNIYENAFSSNESIRQSSKEAKEQYIDIRICISENETVMRFRDNAPKFDPISQAAVYNSDPDDMVKNIGYRIVSGYAKEMSYSRIYNTNILRIVL